MLAVLAPALALTFVTVYALYWAQGRIATYLWCQLLYTPIVWATYYAVGVGSRFYLWVYTGMTVLMLALAFRIVLSVVQSPYEWIETLLTGVVLGLLVLRSLKVPTVPDAVNIGEGVLLIGCGAAIGRYAKHRPFLALSLLWLALGGFRMGFVLHNALGAWLSANGWVPAWMTVTGICCLGVALRKVRLVHVLPHRS